MAAMGTVGRSYEFGEDRQIHYFDHLVPDGDEFAIHHYYKPRLDVRKRN